MAKPSIYLIEASTHTRRALLEEIGAKEPEWRVFAFPLVTKALREWETAEPALVLVDADGVFTREEIMELANKSASGPSGGIHLLSSCENGPPEALKQLALGWIPKPPAGAALPRVGAPPTCVVCWPDVAMERPSETGNRRRGFIRPRRHRLCSPSG